MDEIAADPSHPRYASLLMRHRLEEAEKKGMLAGSALIAHGRGEAFDYLLGEVTTPSALDATRHALASMVQGKKTVLSVNGNVAALASDEMLILASKLGCPLEVNIFYRTPERMDAILGHISERKQVLGLEVEVLGHAPNARIPGLKGPRAACHKEGILDSDVILVPLEDGDRCRALMEMGKTVIVIDLNPRSRSSREGTITIVDELSRALKNMIAMLENEAEVVVNVNYDNNETLEQAMEWMLNTLKHE